MVWSVRARLLVALSLSMLVLGALAAPTSAAVHVRWVDNDSKKGDGPRSCDTANFHTIQAAVDASHPGDSVFVCPGTYNEQVIVSTPGLLIQSRPTRSAIIIPPEAEDIQLVEGGYDLVDILADDVSFVGFKINFQGGDLQPNVQPATTCFTLDTAIFGLNVSGLNIKANSIKSTGDNTLSGECGYLVGVGIINGTPVGAKGQAASLYGSDTIDISRNRIVDFKYAGVITEGDVTSRIYNNSIRYIHANDPATCVVVPVLGVNPDLTFPCDLPTGVTAPKAYQLPPDESGGVIIEGGLADLRNNSVYSTFNLATCEISCDLFLGLGVGTFDTAPGSIVRNNRVDGTFFAMSIGEPNIAPVAASQSSNLSSLPKAPDGTQVTGNRLTENFVGLAVTTSHNEFYGNRAHLNLFGSLVGDGAADNVFELNDFSYNLVGDCVDETTGTGTLNTANNWDAANFGQNNNPDGLCIETSPF
jgi:hypothetical protein